MAEGDRDPATGLRKLDEKLKAAKARRAVGQAPSSTNRGMGAGFRIAVELSAAIVVGTVIGILLDRWLGTTPWLLIVFFVLGCGAGFRNVYVTAQELDRSAREEKRRKATSGTDVDGPPTDKDGGGQG